ncbi:alpha/beta hydrolase [Autumnicola psychrophila]|uniref:Proline iminopeptidase n=1 Tax=Autumnicola psychrophila TaxID=3075592 RepID=A0ABU3DR31_9FLAO|nr:alpha/beta hydrolase [Zunongwangia sp. F225]MDT0686180.1 alpha/beta hydrolase [Zunongwangia sp. F225]
MNTRLCTFFIFLSVLSACNRTYKGEVLDGVLEVPENRNNQNSQTIELVYKVLKANTPDSTKVPIVYLQGGPGGATLIMEEYWANHPLRNDRDIVLMDQRGTGESEAICVNSGKALFTIMRQDYNIEEDFEATKVVMAACKKTIQQKGSDLAGYNSRENATDFEDLRKVLGYKKWNLFGVSYGSRLGLTIMRDFPESVRSAVLMGVFPPEFNMYGDRVRSLNGSLLGVLQSCKENKSCNKQYPNLKERLHKVLTKLQSSPLSFNYKNEPFVLNSHDAFVLLFVSLFDIHTIENIPFFIESLENGETETIIEFLKAYEHLNNLLNLPMNFSFNAYEELPFYDKENLDMAIQQSEFGFGLDYYNAVIKIMTDWHSYRASDIEKQPVISDVPTLLISGSLDPVTPPKNAIEASKKLKNSYEVTFKNESHSFFNTCLLKITENFINNPSTKPNMNCSSEIKPIEWHLSKSSQ